jgi:hypothetical protein
MHGLRSHCTDPSLLPPCTTLAHLRLQAHELLPDTDPQQIWREVELLRQSAHERIVPLLGVVIMARGKGARANACCLRCLRSWLDLPYPQSGKACL